MELEEKEKAEKKKRGPKPSVSSHRYVNVCLGEHLMFFFFSFKEFAHYNWLSLMLGTWLPPSPGNCGEDHIMMVVHNVGICENLGRYVCIMNAKGVHLTLGEL